LTLLSGLDGTTSSFDSCLGTLGNTDTAKSNLAGQGARKNHLCGQRISRNNAGLLKNKQIDIIHRKGFELRKTHFTDTRTRQRNKAPLWQTTLHGHLTALKANFMETTGSGLLALVTAAGSLTQTATDAATDSLGSVLCARCRFDGIQAHLSLTLNEVSDLGNHASHCRSVLQFHRMVETTKPKTANGCTMGLLGTDNALDERDLNFLSDMTYP
jgi:hypothetical protein